MAKEKKLSRSARYAKALLGLDEMISEIEELKSEMESWRDSIPENLQGSDKYNQVDECCNDLESAVDALNEINRDIEFPGMFG